MVAPLYLYVCCKRSYRRFFPLEEPTHRYRAANSFAGGLDVLGTQPCVSG